ncbi:hypothetical protein [Sphingomonas sp. SRS2]|uniref:hypothetical protein n=1 Tax=Sphingomonas sp. SRS2 TaxID=133190 RepID=UPI00128DAF2D|nr:hypothetical protein [Sphingomonas sp. SRS2]
MKLGKGVVAKTSHATIATVGVWIVVVCRLGESATLNVALMLAGAAATGLCAWWVKSTQAYAERNPAQAMLEGAEFLEYRRLEEQAKNTLPPADNRPGLVSPTEGKR